MYEVEFSVEYKDTATIVADDDIEAVDVLMKELKHDLPSWISEDCHIKIINTEKVR